MAYTWKTSAAVAALIVGCLVLLPLVDTRVGAEVVGRLIGSAADIRFLLAWAVGLFIFTFNGPIVAAVVVSAGFAGYLSITLPPIWAELDRPPISFLELMWPRFVVALFLYALVHVVRRKL